MPLSPPEGWYPDPRGGALLRRWVDGAWTDETQPMPPPFATAAPAGRPHAEPAAHFDGWPPDQHQEPATGTETAVYTARLHPILGYARPLFLTALITVLSLAAASVTSPIGLFVSLHILASPLYIVTYLRYRAGRYELTNRHVARRGGVISRHMSETLLSKVESVRVHQSGTGRLLGYGTVIIGGTGGHTQEFVGVRTPNEFRDAIQRQVEAVRGL